MEAVFQISDDILIASIKGEIDHHGAAPLRSSIDESMKAFACKNLILDFSDVEKEMIFSQNAVKLLNLNL